MHSPLHLHAFQQAVNPTALMRIQAAKQQDALAIHTTAQQQIWQQQRLDKLATVAEDGRAWVSVADGVSSSPCADFASRSLLQVLHAHALPHAANALPGLVRQALQDWQSRHLRPRTLGAACTLASLLYVQGQVCAVNCGDSRIWRLRPQADGSVQWLQISRDHTLWQQMVDAGEVQAEEAQDYASLYQGLAHCLVLGDNADEDADQGDAWLYIWHGQAIPGDCYLLATDGLHDTLPAAQLQALWRADQSPADNLAALHQAWQRAGGPDDISVLALCSTTG